MDCNQIVETLKKRKYFGPRDYYAFGNVTIKTVTPPSFGKNLSTHLASGAFALLTTAVVGFGVVFGAASEVETIDAFCVIKASMDKISFVIVDDKNNICEHKVFIEKQQVESVYAWRSSITLNCGNETIIITMPKKIAGYNQKQNIRDVTGFIETIYGKSFLGL